MEGEEEFEVAALGEAKEVVQERICDDELILIKKWVTFSFVYDYTFFFNSSNKKVTQCYHL